MRGSPVIEKRVGLWSRLHEYPLIEGLLLSLSVGILAGLAGAHIRLHLGLSGHKVLFWLTPILVVRFVHPCRFGVTTGIMGATMASIAVGGHLAGGVMGLPLMVLAGILVDAIASYIDLRKTSFLTTFTLMAGCGVLANCIAFVKRQLLPAGPQQGLIFSGPGLWPDFVSYAAFGLLAGVLASTIVLSIRKRCKTSHDVLDRDRV